MLTDSSVTILCPRCWSLTFWNFNDFTCCVSLAWSKISAMLLFISITLWWLFYKNDIYSSICLHFYKVFWLLPFPLPRVNNWSKLKPLSSEYILFVISSPLENICLCLFVRWSSCSSNSKYLLTILACCLILSSSTETGCSALWYSNNDPSSL